MAESRASGGLTVFKAAPLTYTQDFATVNLTTTYTQVTASTTEDIKSLVAWSNGGVSAIVVGVGAVASEVIVGGIVGSGVPVPLWIPKGSRIAIKAVAGAINTGTLVLVGYN